MTMLANPFIASQFDNTMWRIGVDRYHAMLNAGVITTEDRLELIDGYLVEKEVVKPPHRFATTETTTALTVFAQETHFVVVQGPLTMDDSEPEPDVMLVRGKSRDYLERHPYPEDVAILVEVSDATLLRDQNAKKTLYAEAEVAVYWIVNLVHGQIEVYSQPEFGMYTALRSYRKGQDVPVVVDGVEIGRIPTSNILP